MPERIETPSVPYGHIPEVLTFRFGAVVTMALPLQVDTVWMTSAELADLKPQSLAPLSHG